MASTLPRVTGSDGQLAARLVQLAFDTIARNLIDTGGKSIGIRWGTGTFEWSASVSAAPVDVPHGLTSCVFAAAIPENELVSCGTDTYGDTTFRALARFNDETARTTTGDFHWFAIG